MDPRTQTVHPAPILVLGVGNVLLGDDGVGLVLLEEVREIYDQVAEVECIDGGTQGLALLGYLEDRRAIVILDAYSAGKVPGEVSVLSKPEIVAVGALWSTTAHEGNAGELLAVARLLDQLPEHLLLVGVEPERVHTELGLSPRVTAALSVASACVRQVIEQVLTEIRSVPVPLEQAPSGRSQCGRG